jgi:hypothetical protein
LEVTVSAATHAHELSQYSGSLQFLQNQNVGRIEELPQSFPSISNSRRHIMEGWDALDWRAEWQEESAG